MPRKPKKPCAHPGCPELVDNKTYCEKHETKYKKEKWKQADSKRGTSKERGYGANHRKLRKIVLAEEPLCRHCKQEGRLVPATEMDHIDGNVYNLERDNLQGLCKSCHSKKTVKEQGGFKGG